MACDCCASLAFSLVFSSAFWLSYNPLIYLVPVSPRISNTWEYQHVKSLPWHPVPYCEAAFLLFWTPEILITYQQPNTLLCTKVRCKPASSSHPHLPSSCKMYIWVGPTRNTFWLMRHVICWYYYVSGEFRVFKEPRLIRLIGLIFFPLVLTACL